MYGVENCKKKHNKLLHAAGIPEIDRNDDKIKLVAQTSSNQQQTLLKIVPVYLKTSTQTIKTYALLDSASTVTLIKSSLAQKLEADGPKNILSLKWGDGRIQHEDSSKSVKLSISGTQKDAKIFTLRDVRTVEKIPHVKQSIKKEEMLINWPFLRNVNFEGYNEAIPEILIGEDNALLISSMKVIYDSFDSPIASKTRLGWIVSGKEKTNCSSTDSCFYSLVFHICEGKDDSLHQLVKSTFSTEEFGVSVKQDKSRSREDDRAMLVLENTTKRISESRWETGLLWRKSDIILPESRFNAANRLYCLERKLDKNDNLKKLYSEKIDDYVAKGYLKKVVKSDLPMPLKSWYLPHFPVFNPKKTGKLRIVFDAAAKSKGVCLNDFLVQGPDLLNSLPVVLLKFRQKKIAFTADIKEMFHQIKINSGDVACQKILWRGNNRTKDPDVYEMTVMIFGATCSPSGAIYVKNQNALQFVEEKPVAVTAIIDKHYVDDYLDCVDNEEEAMQIIEDVIEIHRRGGFEIRNWICTSYEVTQSIPESLRNVSNESNPINIEKGNAAERILGVWWNKSTDSFTFKISFDKVNEKILSGSKRPTKREVLQMVMSVYDPLGFVSHFVVKGKMLLQLIWRSKIGWDDELSEKLNDTWENWITELQNITSVDIPRCYTSRFSTSKEIELHVFCDASEDAFAAVAYFRIEENSVIDVSFVASKTRVSPLNPISIPRLELQAALMGSRLSKTLMDAHDVKISKIFLWSDSTTVLCWIKADARRFKPFVAHRVGEILELTNLNDWNWISTTENVADEATRSSKPCSFDKNSRWYSGPKFLHQPFVEWQGMLKIGCETSENQEADDNLEFVGVTLNNHNVEAKNSYPEINRFSSYNKLIRATAWMHRFIQNCRKKAELRKKGELSPQEIQNVEMLWIRKCQFESFPVESERLSRELGVGKDSKLNGLSVRLNDISVLILEGRTQNNQNTLVLPSPYILDGKHPFTILLIQRFHKEANHDGTEYVLNEIRQRFWIIGVKVALRKVKYSCLKCRIKRAKPTAPMMGQLPIERLTPKVHPFTFTGVDYFGPLEVKIGRRIEKRYGVLFTCLTVRAVHLEIAASLTTDACVMAIRRFIGRRGSPVKMFSDNGTNLRGADTEMRKALAELNQEVITAEMTLHGIEWHFIPPVTPHMGGCWERLVRSVKTALQHTLATKHPTEEVLQTVFIEAEHLINSRPLTEVSVDPDELESLTPNHLLLGRSAAQTPIGKFNDTDMMLRKQWRISQRLADIFWTRWVREYLPTLTRRRKWQEKEKPVKVDDVVIIADPSGPRGAWPKGVITSIYPGKDGVIRVVDVKTATGTYRRPVVKICVLDLEVKNCDEVNA